MNSLTLFLSFCLILITNSPSLTNANGSDLISQICKASVNQKECTDILTAYPRIMHANNFFELAEAILQLSLYKAIEGQKFLRTLMKSENVPAIAQCANSDYESVITAYKSALSKLKDDPKTAKHYARDAGNGPVSCETALAATTARGLKKHLKRLNARKHWMLDKLGGAFAPKPSSGSHKSRECLPLILILRNRLKYALTYLKTRLDWNRVRTIQPNPHLGNRVGTTLDETNPKTMQDLGNHHGGWCAFSGRRCEIVIGAVATEGLPKARWRNQNKKKGELLVTVEHANKN
ncbi:40S ribosomal protein S4 [Glycine soja]|nr:40S ribosomal protein S4 [Glycine soja]